MDLKHIYAACILTFATVTWWSGGAEDYTKVMLWYRPAEPDISFGF